MSFRLSNFAVINDGIIAVSLNLSILFIAIWTTIIKRFSVGILPLNHYICSGINPQENLGTKAYQSMAKKYNSSLIVVSLCFLLHVGLGPKILMFKRRSEKKVEPIILGNLNQQHPHEDNCLEGNIAQKSFSPLRYVLIYYLEKMIRRISKNKSRCPYINFNHRM